MRHAWTISTTRRIVHYLALYSQEYHDPVVTSGSTRVKQSKDRDSRGIWHCFGIAVNPFPDVLIRVKSAFRDYPIWQWPEFGEQAECPFPAVRARTALVDQH